MKSKIVYLASLLLIWSACTSQATNETEAEGGLLLSGKVGYPQDGLILIDEINPDGQLVPFDTITLNDDYSFQENLRVEQAGIYRVNFYNQHDFRKTSFKMSNFYIKMMCLLTLLIQFKAQSYNFYIDESGYTDSFYCINLQTKNKEDMDRFLLSDSESYCIKCLKKNIENHNKLYEILEEDYKNVLEQIIYIKLDIFFLNNDAPNIIDKIKALYLTVKNDKLDKTKIGTFPYCKKCTNLRNDLDLIRYHYQVSYDKKNIKPEVISYLSQWIENLYLLEEMLNENSSMAIKNYLTKLSNEKIEQMLTQSLKEICNNNMKYYIYQQ